MKKCLLSRTPAAAYVVLAFAMSAAANATTYSWDGGDPTGNTWGTANNWNPNGAPTFGTSADLIFNNLTRPTNDLGNPRTVRSISYGTDMDGDFLTTFRTFSGGSSASLTLQAASGNATITVDTGATGNINLGYVSGTGGAVASLVLGSNLDIVHNGTGNLTFSRRITGANGFTKTGTGTMVSLNVGLDADGSNTFSGAANFNGGRAIFANTAAVGADLNSASAVNLGGGTLEIRTTNALNKTLTSNITVSSASTLAYNNTAATDQSLTMQTGTMVLNGNLTVQNISTSSAGNNIINITRSLTGGGDLIIDTYNNVSSGASSFSNGRVQLSGDNTGWTGNLVIAKGTAQFSGNSSFIPTAGSITLGTTGDSFGAALGFNQASTDVNLNNAITVTTGGMRLIRNNGGPGTTNNIFINGDLTLDGTLTIDHAGLGAGKAITIAGNATGAGGLNVTFVGLNPVADSSVRLTGTNTYTGATAVMSGKLVISGSIGASAVTVSGTGTVLATDAAASFGSTLAIQSGSILAAGDAGTAGTATVTGGTTFNNGSIFSWDINSSGTSYDKLVTASLVDGDAAGGSVFRIVASDATFADVFWNTTRTWADIFTTNGAIAISDWANAFTSVTVVNSSFAPITPVNGSFSASGNTLTWTAVPEPTSALAGLLVAAGLVRRRR